jgi:hypothetical protein
MYSDISYYFSKWRFLFVTLFIVSATTGIIYYALLFYPDAWQYSLLFASPLVIFLFILPEYIQTLYFLITQKPALILTKEKLVNNFRNKEYEWSEIKRIEYKLNEGLKAQGGYIALYLQDSNIARLPDTKFKCKRSDLLTTLIDFHNKYKTQRTQNGCG